MAITIPRGQSDTIIDQIIAALTRYEADHPSAEIAVYRHNPVSIRVRIIDPDLDGLSKSQRSQLAWRYLDQLTEEAQGDISTLLLLTSDETDHSMANLEFEDPVPSQL